MKWDGLNIIFLLLALLAEIIGTIGGFGSSVFFVPIGNFYFDFHTVLGLTALFHLASNISKITLFKGGINKSLLIYLGIPSVIFVILGGVLSEKIQTKWLELILGMFLIGLSLLFLIKKNLAFKPNKKESVLGGSLSGFAAGLLGTGGAIRGITMAAFNLEKSTFIATSAIIDLVIDFTRTLVYFFNGYMNRETLIYVPFLFLIGILGTYLGKKILHHISQEKFKKISLVLIAIIGVLTVISFVLKK